MVDLGLGLAAALASKFLLENGARVLRVQPPEGDPFGKIYPAYETLRTGSEKASGALDDLLAKADVCIVGGEDFPGITAHPKAAALSANSLPEHAAARLTPRH